MSQSETNTRNRFINHLTDFLSEFEMSEAAFGLSSVNDNKFVSKLQNGAGTTLTNIERAEAFMADYRKKRLEEAQAFISKNGGGDQAT